MTNTMNVGLVGYKFMGRSHSNAYRQVQAFFPDVALQPVLRTVCGRDTEAVQTFADQFGWESVETDWRKLVVRDDIGLIDVSTPGDTHAAISIAAAQHGKHIFCEKPLANTLDEAKQMLAAVQKAGVVGMVNFNYRRVPAVQLAKKLIEEGRIGKVYHWRAVYLQDWIMDPNFPLVWRLQKNVAGSGTLGDLGAHIVDLARMLVGEIASVTGLTNTFIKQRPVLAETSGGLAAAGGQQMGEVTVDDAALFLARFANDAIGTFEVTRFANGRANYNSFEINGSKGSIVFNLERMNELNVLFSDDPPEVRGFRNILTTDGTHKYLSAWWPPGHIIGWEHTFTHGVYDLLNGIAKGITPDATFEDGLRCQAVLDAVEKSAGSGAWVEPTY
ncbi:MAG: Gfo/Idh/MocA family oxidoreductase [Chloroflexi bacterium AL-W]|nr:Gfo/Idh/MocA family oxidoreductase [Chloroflexi bacterium AL-N1]NOK64724.1 Gfo/Idh/MocA family oxidoreductase [Chloroflexi bacterium AL-N10]NOK75965.1 Gfo/Idh/MocA family oxidoreductase [Chloroflexi bacterium AL-N5]NOK80276.1 Gfo/Idh/MocA family oxidoreductase [Chloroflexi bacterium AL-W]NOK86789.1 Gfo/Idh/MocA family oxidoreductase [Chloroflexi bacterium AL-N15]